MSAPRKRNWALQSHSRTVGRAPGSGESWALPSCHPAGPSAVRARRHGQGLPSEPLSHRPVGASCPAGGSAAAARLLHRRVSARLRVYPGLLPRAKRPWKRRNRTRGSTVVGKVGPYLRHPAGPSAVRARRHGQGLPSEPLSHRPVGASCPAGGSAAAARLLHRRVSARLRVYPGLLPRAKRPWKRRNRTRGSTPAERTPRWISSGN